MEGIGEGIAAVRWLSDAGLAFSFLSRIRSRRTQETGIQPAQPQSDNSSNAVASQTLSEHHYKRWRSIKEPYASTYQVSHGGVDTSTHVGWHTELPPQRQKPSSALGNFEMGNTNRCRSSARSDIHRYRVSRDATASAGIFEGCKFRPQQERYVEAFVRSLRKYPCVTQRSPTAEMLKQLLNTSRKHPPKQSQATITPKKRRHQWDKPRPLASSTPYASRYKENHRRLRRKKQANAEVNSKEKEYSVPGAGVSFDYMNSGARSSAEFVDKTIQKRLFKNVFREKFRDKREPVTAFPVCPTIQDRYRKHVKKYHSVTSKTPYVDSENLTTCSKCFKKRPCACETARGFRRTIDQEEQAKRQFESAIFSWLQEIPVYPNEDPHDKITRDATVKTLAETLSGLKNGDFAIEGQEIIKRALDNIPMWHPKDKRECDRFKNDITDNLLEKIKGIKELEKSYETNQSIQKDISQIKNEEREEEQGKVSEYKLEDQKDDYLYDKTNVRIKKRVKVEESSPDIPSNLIMRGMETSKAQDYIYSTVNGNVPDSQFEGTSMSKELLAMTEYPSPSMSEHRLGPVANSQGIKSKQMFTSKDSQGIKTSSMSSTNHLNTFVKNWCEALQISDIDQGKKQDLANKIILKIGEMNMNPDILNDDILYDEIIQDFIELQLNELHINEQITNTDKEALLDQIKQIKNKIQDDFISRKYKQQLRDTISNVLPVIPSPTVEEVASVELMKENLADDFINLNYSVDGDISRIKFKRKIMDEVNKYINYLRRCPATPFNTKKLSEDLYTALKNVPVPDDESMRTEVESVRIKDIINDWLKTLPMSKQSKSEQLHTNKIVTLMAHKLQELENEFRPDFEEIAVAEIVIYLKKLPFRNKINLHGMANKLVEKIKNTAESRAFVEGSRSNLTDDCLCEDFPMSCVAGRTSHLSRKSIIPPCGLSIEYQEMMQRIRERSLLCEAGTQSRRCRDAAVNPPPLDNESQTEVPCPSQYCPRTEKPEHVWSKPASVQHDQIPIGTRPGPSAVGQSDLSPCVQVKEYDWDSYFDNQVENATRIPADGSGRIFIPSSPLNSERICRPRTTPRRVPVKPRSRLEYPTCRTPTPRRQISSACPNDYYSRPKHCSRPPPILEREHLRSSWRHVGPSYGRMRSPLQSCQDNPTTSRNRCAPMHVCPHPSYLYFK